MKTFSVLCIALCLAACGGGGGGAGPTEPLTTSPPDTTAPEHPYPGPIVIGIPLAADKIIEPPMVAIPAGSFEWPGVARTINVSAFQIAKYEVTVGQYRQFVNATGYQPAGDYGCWKLASGSGNIEVSKLTWDAQNFEQNEYHPVTCVSDIDAKAYMTWLETNTGKAYRLPSEAEWEYAYRGGQTKPWYGEISQICRYANVRDTVGFAAIKKINPTAAGNFACSDGAAFTSVVGMYEPNPFGLYDMAGNLGEIFDDCEHSSYAAAPVDGSVWNTGCRSANNAIVKTRRGGGWVEYPDPSPSRHYGSGNHASFEGFRIALKAPVTAPSPATIAFEAELDKARAADRLKRAAAAALPFSP